MKKTFLVGTGKNLVVNVATVVFSVFLIALVGYAATTISTNISTDGNLTVTGTADVTGLTTLGSLSVSGAGTVVGLSTFGSVTSTSVTTTNYLQVGGYFGPLPTSFNYVGDVAIQDTLAVGGNASTTGDLYVSGSTFDVSTATPTTTAGIFSRSSLTSTTTIGAGSLDGTSVKDGCLELVQDGAYYNCFISGITGSSTPGLICLAGRCN